MRILLAAENFAFGPAGKMLALAAGLRPYAKVLGFAGAGTAADLASRFPFDKFSIIPANGLTENAWSQIVQGYDTVVSVLEADCALAAIKLQKPVVWVDTLFWWWTTLPDFLDRVDLYIYQRSVDATSNLQRFGPRFQNRLLGVGPLIDIQQRAWRPRAGTLLICYGGMEAEGFYRVGRESTYPYTLTRILLEKVDLSDFHEITVVGNSRVIPDLARRWADRRLRTATLNHSEFLDAMAAAEVVLTVPGLETPLEAFYCGVPVIFLPPSNASQYWQLDHFRSLRLAPASVHFADFLPRLELVPLLREERNETFLRQLKEFEQSSDRLDSVGVELDRHLRTRSLWSPPVINAGRKYVEELGGNGLSAAVDAIRSVFGMT